ncbi:MAG TPA: hypothetical protein VK943_14605 [Arenibaculum sp.]|nr:hypothetical protein [Arenibaculum sp.]
MPVKKNPLNLNALQLKTLTLLQELARLGGEPAPEGAEGDLFVTRFPHAHGNHFHLGDAVVSTADATGLSNPAVYAALDRKGLTHSMFPQGVVVTAAGMAYETGLGDRILHRSDH